MTSRKHSAGLRRNSRRASRAWWFMPTTSLLLVLLLSLIPSVSLAIGILQGSVTSATDSAPLANVQVTTDTGYSASTNAGGDFFLVLPVNTPHVVTFSLPDYIPQSQEIVLNDGDLRRLDISLEIKVHVQSVYPTLAMVGQPLPVTITGYGFKQSSRVSLNLDSKNRMLLIGSVALQDTPRDMVVAGNRAYTVSTRINTGFPNTGILEISDITDPTEPIVIGTLPMQNASFSAVVVDETRSLAYVADSQNGLHIIDVGTPSTPGLLKTVPRASPTQSAPSDVAFMGPFVLLADYAAGLQVIDAAVPQNASIIQNVAITCRSVAVEQSMAYIADLLNNAVTAIDLGNPLKPGVRGSIDAVSYPHELAAANGMVYVADDDAGLRIIDFSDPDVPWKKGTADTPDVARGVAVVGDTVYVADSDSGLVIVNVTDPLNPSIEGNVATPHKPNTPVNSAAARVAVRDGIAYVLDTYTGLHTIDVADPLQLNLAGAIDVDGGAAVVRVAGSLAYLAVTRFNAGGVVTGGQLRVYDISDPASPILMKSVDTPEAITDFVISAGSAYVCAGNLLLRINADPASLTIEKTLTLPGAGSALAVSADKAYIVSDSQGLLVVELNSQSGNYFTVTGSYNTPDGYLAYTSTSVFVANGIVYWTRYLINTSSHLIMVDVTTPSSPTLLGMESALDLARDVRVQGSIAYVADGGNLKTVDVSDPANPSVVGTWSGDGSGLRDICAVNNNRVFAADGYYGLLVIDVSVPAAPVLVGSVDSRGSPEQGVISDGLAYLVEKDFGLTVLPVPLELTIDPAWSATRITTTLAGPTVPGNYTIRVFNGSNSGQVVGGVTFTDIPDLLTSKAIIVAGGGPYAGNLIWEETKAYANHAYDNLIYQGYRHEDIMYLTDEPDALARYGALAAGANLLPATRQNLVSAIQWAGTGPDAGDLLIFLEDHGDTEEFIIRGGTTPETVTASDLKAWLDSLQAGMQGKVILVYDACRSGSFLFKMAPPPGKTRIVLTSSAAGQAAYFLSPRHSFSSHFWSTFTGRAGDKAILTDAFNNGAAGMASYQTAQLDANGNGVPNEPADFTELQGIEGTIYALRRQFYDQNRSRPVIAVVSPDQVTTGSSATLMAGKVYDIDGDGISRVFAEVMPPDSTLDSSPVTVSGAELPALELIDPDKDGTYQVTKTDFNVRGTYIVTYYAEDTSGISSQPRTSLVTQPNGSQVLVPDDYEDDNSPAAARVIVLNNPTPQSHSFHIAGDRDWVKFYGIAGEVYSILAMNPTIISDPVIDIFSGNDTTTPMQSSNSAGSGQTESLIGWNCPADGIYYARLRNNSPHFGANVRYKLRIYNPTALSLPGYITGRITSGGSGVAGAIIRAGGATAITLADGSYILYLAPGAYTVTVSANGYEPTSFPVNVGNGEHKTITPREINSVPRITNAPFTLIKAGELFSFVPAVLEPDNDPLTFTVTGKPAWASFNRDNGKLRGTPSFADTGKYGPVTITVRDPKGAGDTIVFTLEVLAGDRRILAPIYQLLLRP